MKQPNPGDLIIANDVWDGEVPHIGAGDVILVIESATLSYGFSLCVMHRGVARSIIADKTSFVNFTECNK